MDKTIFLTNQTIAVLLFLPPLSPRYFVENAFFLHTWTRKHYLRGSAALLFLAIHNGYVQRLSLFIHLKVSLAHALNRLLNPSFNSSTSTLLCNYDYVWFFFFLRLNPPYNYLEHNVVGATRLARWLAISLFTLLYRTYYIAFFPLLRRLSLLFFYSAYLLSMSVYFALIQTTELELHFFSSFASSFTRYR